MTDSLEITEGGDNIFADIGVPNRKAHRLKADLVIKIMTIMRERELSQAATARLLGVTQPEVSNMLRGQFHRVSVERLLEHLVALGQDVEIVVKPRRDMDQVPQLSVA